MYISHDAESRFGASFTKYSQSMPWNALQIEVSNESVRIAFPFDAVGHLRLVPNYFAMLSFFISFFSLLTPPNSRTFDNNYVA